VSLQLVIDRAVTLARSGDLELLTNPSSDFLGARMANEEVSNQLGCTDTSVGRRVKVEVDTSNLH